MVSKYILSVSQCVFDDLYKKKISFNYVSDSVVFNDCHDLRNNCSYKSVKLHSLGYLYCRKHNEILTKCFSYVCKNASRFCGDISIIACNEYFDYYKFYCLAKAIKICISSLIAKGKRFSRYVELFDCIDADNFFQTCGKIKQNGTE